MPPVDTLLSQNNTGEGEGNNQVADPNQNQDPNNQDPQGNGEGDQGDGEGQAGAEGSGDNDGDAQGAPESYETFTLPEDLQINESELEGFTSLARDLNLSQAQAQQLVDYEAERMLAIQSAQQEAWTQQQVDWRNESQSDQEIGGNNFDGNIATAVKALDRFGTPELKSALNESGMGNHPEVIRAFYRVGKAISESSFVPGGSSSTGQKSRDEILYGT